MDTMTKRETLTAGDILHCGWGSDMSINDYYEVTRVTPSGKTAYIRPLRKTYAGSPNDMGGCRAYPMVAGEGRFSGEEEAHRVHHFDDGRVYLRLSSFEFAFPMDMAEAAYGCGMKHSTTLSMGTTVAGNPYLIQAAAYITPGLPYFAAIGIDDEDRHIRERVQTACETVGYVWPECRTTLLLLPTNQPKRPGLCALSAAVCIMAADGTIGIPDLESTVILGGVNADGTIPPLDKDVDLTALIEHAREQGIQRVIIPAADLVRAGRPDGVEIIGVESLRDLKR